MRRLVLLLLFLLAGCDPSAPAVCTEEFRSYVVRVVDDAGEPVPGLETRSVVEETGTVLDVPDGPAFAPDTYYVATDANRDAIGPDETGIRFEAEGGGLAASATFVFRDDGCHVRQVSGPEEIAARPR